MLRDVLERSARPFSKRGSGFFASAATQRALTAFSVARCPRGENTAQKPLGHGLGLAAPSLFDCAVSRYRAGKDDESHIATSVLEMLERNGA